MARKKVPPGPENQSAVGLLALSFLLGFIGQLCFRFDWSVIAGLLFYLAAAFIFVRSLRQYRSDDGAIDVGSNALAGRLSALSSTKGIEWLLVLVLLLIAAFFRLYRLDSQPLSLWLDESLAGLNALEIIEGKNAPIWDMTPLDRWRPDWVKTSNLYLYYVVSVFKVFGAGYFGLKMVSVVPAIASVIVGYYLFKEMAGVPIAFLSAFLIAVSQWHVTVSRWGWDAVLMCLLQLASYWLLIKGLNTGKKLHFALSGLLMGLCLYTYIASWIALAIALTLLVFKCMLERHGLRNNLPNGLFFLVSCLVVFAPLGTYYFYHPGDLVVRTSEVSITKAIQEARSYYPVWESISKYALMFNYKGDSNAIHNFPQEPVLDFVTSIFFVLGLAYYARFWKSSHNMFVLLWFALGLQAGLLSDPSASPHAYRTVMVSPVACFVAGTATVLSLSALWKWLPNFRYKNMTPVIVGITLLGYIAINNYWTYFVRRPKSRDVWEEEGRDGRLPVKLKSLGNKSQTIIVDPLLLWKIVVSNSWFLSYQPGKLFESPYIPTNLLIAESKLSQIRENSELTYICPPVFIPLMRVLFPDAEGELVVSPAGDPVYAVLRVTTAALRTNLKSVNSSWLASVVNKIAFLYENEAAAVSREIGPKERLLRDASQAGFNFAKRLDPEISRERTP